MHHRVRKIRNTRRWRRLSWLNRFRRDDSGIQLVELAIVMPVFLLLFGATAEFGRFFYEYTTVAKAARVGTRYLTSAAVNTAQDTIAKNLVVYGNAAGTGSPVLSGLTTGNVVITRQGGDPVLPQTVKVQIVGFKHQPLFDLGLMINSPSLSLNIDVKPSVTMRYMLTQPPV
jgi:Flp pilus assembly protein TadG